MVATVLTLGISMLPKQVLAAENHEIVAYKIYMPVDYNKVDTSEIKKVTLNNLT
ncbi:hypothetical protein ACWO4B_001872 [Clostridium sporogenes]